MILNILQLLLTLIIFIGVKYLVWYVTEEHKIPLFLEYLPYTCYTCLGFWSLTAIFLASGLITHLWITMGVGLVLTALDAIAQKVDQKNKTVNADDFRVKPINEIINI